jgi:predicted Zn-dependent peptidase
MKNILLPLAAALCCTLSAPAADAIPDRPEKLKFPELNFQPPDAAPYRVQLKAGPVAYVIPDRELPLVNIQITVRCGEYLDPAGKEGLASLAGIMLFHGGTAKMTAPELEERAAFLAAQFHTSVENTSGNVSLNLLSKDLDEGLGLLRDILATPRFQENKVQLRKDQMLQEMRQRNDDSAAIEGREVGDLAFGESFWLNQEPTAKSVQSISHEDLVRFHQRWFHPANFILAVSGDFDRDAMIAKLEGMFADWPFKGEVAPPIPTKTQFAPAGVYLVNKDVNQGRVSIMLPGIMRDDPDFFAATVMNDILGGGGFTSRIMNRVRTEEGLAYSAGSSLPGGIYFAPPFMATFQTKSRTVPYAISLVLNEMRRMTETPVTDQELATTLNGMIERFPRAFSSKAQVAGLFSQEEFTGRYAKDPTFWKTYRDKLRAVTKADVQRVAKRLLLPEQTDILIVGQRDEILLGHPDHPQRLHDFDGGRVIELPLRDPMTMEPQGKPEPIAKPGNK